MYKPPQVIYVRRTDPKFRWSYLVSRFSDSYIHKALQKFRHLVRSGVPQSDWVGSGAWGSPRVPLAPPEGV